MKKLIILVLVVVLIIWGLPKLQGDNISAGSLPGDISYFLDTSWEWAQLHLLTFTDEGKLKLRLFYIDERVAELEELQRKGELSVKKAKELEEDYKVLSGQISEDITKIKDAKENVDVWVQKAQELSDRHQGVIEKITQDAPEKTSDFLESAKIFGESLYNKTEEIFN